MPDQGRGPCTPCFKLLSEPEVCPCGGLPGHLSHQRPPGISGRSGGLEALGFTRDSFRGRISVAVYPASTPSEPLGSPHPDQVG
jgi:hypothetical protein